MPRHVLVPKRTGSRAIEGLRHHVGRARSLLDVSREDPVEDISVPLLAGHQQLDRHTDALVGVIDVCRHDGRARNDLFVLLYHEVLAQFLLHLRERCYVQLRGQPEVLWPLIIRGPNLRHLVVRVYLREDDVREPVLNHELHVHHLLLCRLAVKTVDQSALDARGTGARAQVILVDVGEGADRHGLQELQGRDNVILEFELDLGLLDLGTRLLLRYHILRGVVRRRNPGGIKYHRDGLVQCEVGIQVFVPGRMQIPIPFVLGLMPRADVHALRETLVDHCDQLFAEDHGAAQRRAGAVR